MTIRPAVKSDSKAWEEMRQELWPSPAGEHKEEIAAYFGEGIREPLEVLLAVDDAGKAVGFVELNIRPFAEGCYSGRVAYIEGWFVRPDARRKGIGHALIQAAEEWGRSQRCTEMGSDAVLTNELSIALHGKFGFEVVERQVCFRKGL